MRTQLTIFILVVSFKTIIGQDKMIVSQSFNNDNYYRDCSQPLNSISDLPTVIQFNLHKWLPKNLGNMSDSLTFSHGRLIDLNKYFSEDSCASCYSWLIPKYELNFVLHDISIGIKCFYLQIRLDEYGQVLYSNWSKNEYLHYDDKTKFKPRIEVEAFALNYAKEQGFAIDNYLVDFKCSRNEQNMCWVFKFLKGVQNGREYYNYIDIDCILMKVVDEYWMQPQL